MLRENGELESKSEAKKRHKEEQKEKLKAEKEAARLEKEANERTAREAADVVRPVATPEGDVGGDRTDPLGENRTTRLRTMASSR